MPKLIQLDDKRTLRQKQQAPFNVLPQQSVDLGQLSPSVLAIFGADAIVGSPADVAAGMANYSSFQNAHDAVTTGSTILLLKSIPNTEVLTISKQISVLGLGYGSQLNGAVTITTVYSDWKSIRFGGVLTCSVISVGNLFSGCFFVADPAATDMGAGNYFDGVIE